MGQRRIGADVDFGTAHEARGSAERKLASGIERLFYDAVDQDRLETWAVSGVFPNMDWSSDSGVVIA